MNLLNVESGHTVNFAEGETSVTSRVHVFDDRSIWALNAALASGRPLLVRGEPGVGKTQLALAAAEVLDWPLITSVVDAQTEARDLLWSFDAVQRLADAQLLGALGTDEQQARQALAVSNFVRPGPVWWALDWESASDQSTRLGHPPRVGPAGWEPGTGAVLLIDEIDKAESDVPNGLLEALGSSSFTPYGFELPVVVNGRLPLVIVTTNEERALPDAFIRRCLVLALKLPDDEGEVTELLVTRGRAHFPDADGGLLSRIAELTLRDRRNAISNQVTPLPGQAEFLDLVRAVIEIEPEDQSRQMDVLDRVSEFVLNKNAGGR